MKARFIGKRTHEYDWIIPGEIYNIEIWRASCHIIFLEIKRIPGKYIKPCFIPYDSLEAIVDNWDFDVKR